MPAGMKIRGGHCERRDRPTLASQQHQRAHSEKKEVFTGKPEGPSEMDSSKTVVGLAPPL